MWRRRALAALVAAGAALLVSAGPAAAHADLVAATPPPGTGVPQAPGAVVIRFTEPLNPRLSRIEVLDGDGRDVGAGPTTVAGDDTNALRRRLPLLPPGRFTVRWTTVSTLDGHGRRGSYFFGVGTTASADQRILDGPVQSQGWPGLVGRYFALGGLGLWVGAGLVARQASAAGLARRRLILLATAAPALALAGTAVALASAAVAAGGSAASVLDVGASQSGRFRLGVMLAATCGLAAANRSAAAYRLAAVLAVAAEAASGHAASGPLPFLATLSFGAHLVAAGVWTFAIAAAVLAGGRIRSVLTAVSPFAIGGAAVAVITGVTNTAFGVTRPSELTSTGYGRAILVKGAIAIAMVALGALHLRRRKAGGEHTLRRPVAVEAGAVAAVFVVAALLTSIPDPPRQAAAQVVTGSDLVLTELSHYDAVSVAEASGSYVIGLTVFPPRPGDVQVRLHVLGKEAGPESKVRGGVVRASVSGQEPVSMILRPCGSGCLAGRGHIPSLGQWQFDASVDAAGDDVAAAFSLSLPAPDGAEELERALRASETLGSATVREELRAEVGAGPIVSRYRFAAPDAFEIQTGDSHRIVIGKRTWDRSSPGDPWKEGEWPDEAFRWPRSHYRSLWADPAAVRVLGEEVVDGVPSRIVSFVRPGLPAWFKVWVGVADGEIRRETMLAEGHLMERVYELNTPTTITPPVG